MRPKDAGARKIGARKIGARKKSASARKTGAQPVKLLCVADEVDLLVYSSRIKERFGDIDLVLSAGDLPEEYLGFITAMLNRPIVSVAGNHDPALAAKDTGASIEASQDRVFHDGQASMGRIAFKIKCEAGLRILGLPGSMRYNKGPHQYSEWGMRWRLALLSPALLFRRLLSGRAVDIILAHAPPRGIHDGEDRAHRGFSAYRYLIMLANPQYFIHGHIHIYDVQQLREARLGNTTIVNVYGHRVITLRGTESGDIQQ